PQRLQPTGFSIPRGITALQRTCSYDRFHTSQTAIPTAPLIERGQRGGLERSLSAQYFDEESASFERPKHSLKGAQRRLMNQLTVNYAPIWLHLALDALIGAPVSKSAQISPADGILKLSDPTQLAPPPVPLSQKLRIYLFTAGSVSKRIPASAPAQSKKTTGDPIPQKP
ncbi:hypothetical protein CRM22_002283, partial [Opisthorchis felineus]